MWPYIMSSEIGETSTFMESRGSTPLALAQVDGQQRLSSYQDLANGYAEQPLAHSNIELHPQHFEKLMSEFI